jgi:hypothetical protein
LDDTTVLTLFQFADEEDTTFNVLSQFAEFEVIKEYAVSYFS